MKKYSVYIVLDCMAEDETDAKTWVKEAVEYSAKEYDLADIEIIEVKPSIMK